MRSNGVGVVYRDVWRDRLSRSKGQEGGALREDDLALGTQTAPRGKFDDSYIKAAYLKAIYTAEMAIDIATLTSPTPIFQRRCANAEAWRSCAIDDARR